MLSCFLLVKGVFRKLKAALPEQLPSPAMVLSEDQYHVECPLLGGVLIAIRGAGSPGDHLHGEEK